MIQHPNALLVHQCLQAANVGDRQTLRALWADDIVWRVQGAGPWQGEIKGPDEIFEYLGSLGAVGQAGFNTAVEDVMVSNTRASVLCQAWAQLGDRVLDASYLLIASIAAGRIQEIVSVPIDPERVAAFWG
ncbi:MAG: nuclear transport factor 2 family protein [Myxococcota bacterium]